MNKRQRKKQLKKKIGAEAYKDAERRTDAIFRAFAYELVASTRLWAEKIINE
jgi:hypothetical protein